MAELTVLQLAAESVVDDLIRDLHDRQGLNHAWDAIEWDTRHEIRSEWTIIVANAMRRLLSDV